MFVVIKRRSPWSKWSPALQGGELHRFNLTRATATTNRRTVGHRFMRWNHKSGPPSLLHKINLHSANMFQQFFVDQVSNSCGFVPVVVFFRLIQSQGQRGPASATLRHIDPNGWINWILFKVFIQFFLCRLCNLNHLRLLSPLIASCAILYLDLLHRQ